MTIQMSHPRSGYSDYAVAPTGALDWNPHHLSPAPTQTRYNFQNFCVISTFMWILYVFLFLSMANPKFYLLEKKSVPVAIFDQFNPQKNIK